MRARHLSLPDPDRGSHSFPLRALRHVAAAALLLIIVLAVAAFGSPSSAAAKTIMIVAPHPDDDLLLAAGVIATAKAAGDTVKVVYMTNGDYSGTLDGTSRVRIAVSAEALLGNSASDLIFLGYPDHTPLSATPPSSFNEDSGLPKLLFDYTKVTQTYTTVYGVSQTYSDASYPDYHLAKFGEHATYNGAHVLQDLEQIIADFKPVDIYTTSELDAKTDHEATYWFVRTAMLARMAADNTYSPTLHKGIVWWDGPGWPQAIDPAALTAQPASNWANQPQFHVDSWTARESIPVPATMQTSTSKAAITANTAANPTIVTTAAAHGLTTGDTIGISGSNSTPTINGMHSVTFTDATHFTIPVNVTGAGTAGTVFTYPANPKVQSIVLHGDYTLGRYVHKDEVFWADSPLSDWQLPVTAANIAPKAAVFGSTHNSDNQQLFVKAVDGFIDGSPGDFTREWATDGQAAGATLKLHWSSPVLISAVTLYDRPNGNDQITHGTLTFSDDTSVAVGELPNDGTTGLTVSLSPARVVSGLKLTVDTVGALTTAVGLAEIQVQGLAWAGTFSIAGGAQYATTQTVTLNSAVTGAAEMRFSNDGSTWSTWETYAATRSWDLSANDGAKTVYAQYRGVGGDLGEILARNDTITLDMTPPSGTMLIDSDNTYTTSTAVTLTSTVTGAADMRFSNDGSTWSAWETYTTTKAWDLTTGDGLKTVYAQYRDVALNVHQTSDQITLDANAPVGTMKIDNGAAFAATTAVTLNSDVTDATEMRFSNDGVTWPATWESYAASKAWSLPAGDGTKTVYAQYRTSALNPVGLNDAIVLDGTAPQTTATFAAGWHKAATTVSFVATDGSSGVQRIRASIDGVEQPVMLATASLKIAAPADHSNDGLHRVTYAAQDVAGNWEAARTLEVGIDTRKPTPKAAYKASVKRGKKVTLRYQISDVAPNGGPAKVTIKIKTKTGKTVKTFNLTNRKVNTVLKYQFRCNLKKGSYRFSVYATDAAGNQQSKIATNTLNVM
jgi:LmbE family N-acetylglucosaminyl deacetylase